MATANIFLGFFFSIFPFWKFWPIWALHKSVRWFCYSWGKLAENMYYIDRNRIKVERFKAVLTERRMALKNVPYMIHMHWLTEFVSIFIRVKCGAKPNITDRQMFWSWPALWRNWWPGVDSTCFQPIRSPCLWNRRFRFSKSVNNFVGLRLGGAKHPPPPI